MGLDEHKVLHDDEDLHVCGCDFEIDEGESTLDDELPASRGGIQASAGADDDQRIDGCDLDFKADAPTDDVELPAAKGGVM
jgi:hypothetical protein